MHRLLFVDDEEMILEALKRLFFDDDYEIYTASSGKEALELVKKVPVDLIISDQRMSEMTGVEFLTASRDIIPDTIRIILTAYADMNAAIAAINEGKVYSFIMKPWDNEALKLSVNKALEHYTLLKENKRLNEELKEWNRTLEQKVKDRTQELHQEKHKLINVIDTVKEGFVYCDENGTIIHMNKAAEKYFGGELRELKGKRIDVDVFDPVREIVQKYLVDFKENSSLNEREHNVKLKSGEWYNIRFCPVRDDAFHGLIMQLFTFKERFM